MGLFHALIDVTSAHPVTVPPLLSLILLLLRSIRRVYFHPLSKIPGPWYAKCTSAWLNYHCYIGDECTVVQALHLTYGPILRVSPHDVDIADGDALSEIYLEKAGFRKAECYANFDIDGHHSLFSELDPAKRAPRAKAVKALFSTASLSSGSDVIYRCIDSMVARLRAEAKSGQPVDVLNLARALATDTVTAYLFRRSYGGVEENSKQLSASPFVDTFVAVGRFFYLPNHVFLWLDWLITILMPDKDTNASMAKIDEYVESLALGAEKGSGSYQSRLRDAGISESETAAQCKDLIFAGTDSTGANLAKICWYDLLRKEILTSKPTESDLQSLPYLRGVVKEGLRLSMAQPTRLIRVVPAGGWSFHNHHFPAGTQVGVSTFSLHFNPIVFPEPMAFRPERWQDPTPEMNRDWVPFGVGSRMCIARNLAMAELFMAVQRLVEADVLRGATVLQDKVEIIEWFNSRVRGGKIELVWHMM
ncbi:hypothetical protein MMC13_005382 [Lambiella insularis]|nr:hypothetical protein [Lambiella insularis]